MPRKRSLTLTDAELRLMDLLWDRGALTVAQAVEALPEDDKVAYSTVLTTLRILEQKGYVRHQEQGRAYVYEAIVAREQARRKTLRRVIGQFFDGSPADLVLNVVEHEELTAEEIERLKELIERREKP